MSPNWSECFEFKFIHEFRCHRDKIVTSFPASLVEILVTNSDGIKVAGSPHKEVSVFVTTRWNSMNGNQESVDIVESRIKETDYFPICTPFR
tara:strand:+ start:132 stop:407 length:276 start_codon:yes stop_codon:yes gene_type:complete